MNYGFLIDHRKCIGCHACSTVCKSENEVPLGVYRTWVKYVEKGEFPNPRRHFQVTRMQRVKRPAKQTDAVQRNLFPLRC